MVWDRVATVDRLSLRKYVIRKSSEKMLAGVLLCFVSTSAFVSSEIVTLSSGLSHETSHHEYMKEPLAKISDSTGPSRKLVQFTKSEYLTREVLKVTDNVYVAIGWALANSIMIEGDDGIIIVDTTESIVSMKEILAEFRKITKKPVKAVIFTHFHTDHHHGTHAVIEEGKKLYPNVKIDVYSHEMTKDIMFDRIYIYDVLTTRGVRQIGGALEKDENARTGSGLGPELRLRASDIRLLLTPTVTFTERAKYRVADIEFELIHTPGETDDQITVWLPKEEVALPGDNIYKTFPNLYAIRGTPARDTQKWYHSLDVVRSLGAKYLVGSHTRPVEGKDEVHDTLLVYRDAIKYVHDQTLRLINKGYYPGQIVEQVKLPERLAKHPFLQQHYGTVEWSVKGVFTNYLGWFSGNPRDLHPMSELDHAVRMVKLITYAQTRKECAVEVMLQQAEISHRDSYHQYISTGEHNVNDDKWALELVDTVLALDGLDPEIVRAAEQNRLSSLRALGTEEISANGRNYYMTCALEMESGNSSVVRSKASRAYAINDSPIESVLGMLCLKVQGLKCQYKNITVGLTFTDEGKTFGLTLRNSVCDVLDPLPMGMGTSVSLTTTAQVFKAIKAEERQLDDEVAKGSLKVSDGSLDSYKEFLDCFDPVITV